jgi:hypothetical protein
MGSWLELVSLLLELVWSVRWEILLAAFWLVVWKVGSWALYFGRWASMLVGLALLVDSTSSCVQVVVP